MTTSFRRLEPVLPVRDVSAALRHYEKLGFSSKAYDERDERGPIYGFISRDDIHAHLSRVVDLDPSRNTSACYLYVTDADGLHAEWQRSGVDGRFEPPQDTPYGLREFAHVDADGNLWRVGSPLAKD